MLCCSTSLVFYCQDDNPSAKGLAEIYEVRRRICTEGFEYVGHEFGMGGLC